MTRSDSMLFAKDQFWTWDMFSLHSPRETYPPAAPARYSVFSARNAIYWGLQLLNVPRQGEVLAPAYICRAAVDPLLSYGLTVRFYNVTRDCEIDLDDIERRIGPETKALLLVHYFGFPQQASRIRKLCDKYGLAFVEDCAHILWGETEGKSFGAFGDASVFSWRKFLPLYDGADLVVNRLDRSGAAQCRQESLLLNLKAAGNMLDISLSEGRGLMKVAHSLVHIGESVFRTLAKERVRELPTTYVEPNAVLFDLAELNIPMSRASRWVKAHSDVPKIVARRTRNYRLLSQELSRLDGVRLPFPEVPPRTCPWVLPVAFPGSSDVLPALRERGIPAVTWGWVRPPSVPASFVDAEYLYDNLIFLPIHQCLDDEHMLQTAGVVKEVLRAEGRSSRRAQL